MPRHHSYSNVPIRKGSLDPRTILGDLIFGKPEENVYSAYELEPGQYLKTTTKFRVTYGNNYVVVPKHTIVEIIQPVRTETTRPASIIPPLQKGYIVNIYAIPPGSRIRPGDQLLFHEDHIMKCLKIKVDQVRTQYDLITS